MHHVLKYNSLVCDQIEYELQSQVDRALPKTIYPCPSEDSAYCTYPVSLRKTTNNCTECYGCDHQLIALESHEVAFGLKLPVHRGGTPQWVFPVDHGPMAERSSTGKAIVKVKPCLQLCSLTSAVL